METSKKIRAPGETGASNKSFPDKSIPNKGIDFKAAAHKGLGLIQSWLPDGKEEGREWVARNPTRNDANPGSFKIDLDTGLWSDFATDDSGKDSVSLRAYLRGISQAEAAREILGTSVLAGTLAHRQESKPKAKPVLPIPADSPDIEVAINNDWAVHTHGNPVATWQYRNQHGEGLFYVVRFEKPDGKKSVIPYYCGTDGEWHQGHPINKDRPLFNLHNLVQTNDPVLVVEGEKCASLQVPGFEVTTWSGGANAVSKTNWKVLLGREVVIWPDADESGLKAAKDILASLPEAHILDIQGVAEGWDIVDAVAEGIDPEAFIASRRHIPLVANEILQETNTGTKSCLTIEMITERGLADMVIQDNKDKIVYIPDLKKWFVSDNVAMRRDQRNIIAHLIACGIKKMHGMLSNTTSFDHDGREAMRKRLSNFDKANTIKAVQNRLEADPRVVRTEADFNQETDKINCLNGVVDLRTGLLLPPEPTKWTRAASARYIPQSDYPKKFLESFLPELCDSRDDLLRWFMRYLGYSLTGEISDQSMVIFHGSGQNGKGVLFDIMKGVVGDFYRAADPTMLLDDPNSHTHTLADMDGIRLGTIAEIPKGQSWNDGRLKNITADSEFTARGMYQGNRQIKNVLKLFVSTNTFPATKSNVKGFYRRLRIFPCDHSVPENKKNPTLAAEILHSERDAIFSQLIREAGLWYRDGMLSVPECVKQAVDIYRQDNDRLVEFLTDCTINQNTIDGARLFEAYCAWAERHSEEALKRKIFYKAIEERGFRREQNENNRATSFRGLSLK